MLIELKNIQKTYSTKNGVTFRALSNVSATFDNTGLVFLVGPSGSGKSTLLNVIGGLDGFDSGEIVMAGRSMRSLKAAEIDSLRNTLMGFVFQEFNLLDTLSVYENVKLALDMQSGRDSERVMKALKEMGIEDKARNKTKDLSGGQRQRVAIARALVKDPRIILADEPTGSLDSATGEEVLKILKEMSKTRLVLVVTHDIEKAAEYGDRIIEMKDGRIYRDVRRKLDGEVVELAGAQIVSDTLMMLDKSTTVTEADTEKLNEIITESGRKTFVNVDTDPRRIKAMFPNLREAVDVGKSENAEDKESEDSALSSEAFVPYKPRQEAAQEFAYKKSRLPNTRAMRLGLNNLNHKKVRLAMTIIVAFLAFALFGLAQSFTAYDVRAAIAKTIEKEEYRTLAVISADQQTERIAERDVTAILEANEGLEIAYQYDYSFNLKRASPQYLTLNSFDGVVEVDDVSRLGKQIVYGKSSCDNYSSIIVSEFGAKSMILNRVLSAGDVSQAVGKSVVLNDSNYVIAGIFRSEVMEYGAPSDHEAQREFTLAMQRGEGQLYVKKGFLRDYLGRSGESEAFTLDITYNGKINEMKPSSTSASLSVFSQSFYEKNVVDTDNIIGATGTVASPDDILLGSGDYFLSNLGLQPFFYESDLKNINELNGDDTRRLILYYDGKPVYVSDSFKVQGMIKAVPSELPPEPGTGNFNPLANSGLVVHEDVLRAAFNNILYPVQLFAGISDDVEVEEVVNSFYERGLKINAGYVGDYDNVLMLLAVLRYVLLGLAIIFSLLVILLLYNFISTSIRMTKKQIGILRALGAKKSDTFKIYAIEGFLVTLFALALAAVALAIGAPMLNLLLGSVYGYYFSLFSIGGIVYLTMTALTLIVTVASVFIPLRKFNRITPISAISGKE